MADLLFKISTVSKQSFFDVRGLLWLLFKLKRIIGYMLKLESVFLVFLVIKGFKLINGKLVELVEVLPSLISASETCAKVSVGNVTSHSGSHVESSHCKHVYSVTRNGTKSCGYAFNNACVYVGAF